MIIHSSFIRNMWISATLSVCVTLPFTYPHVLKLLTSNSLLSMIASLASVIQKSLTYPHLPGEAQLNNHQASCLVSIHLIFVFTSNVLASCYLFSDDIEYLKCYLQVTVKLVFLKMLRA